MFKAEFIDALAEKHGCTKAEADKFIKNFFDTVAEKSKEEGFVQITGYGTFEFVQREERIATNPKTREEITVPASNVVKFKPGKKLKNL